MLGCRLDASSGIWVRANFHGHCAESSACSSVPLVMGVEKYCSVGARVVTVTDHDRVTDLSECREQFPDVCFLPGFEYSAGKNMVFAGSGCEALVGLPVDQALQLSEDMLSLICHPQPHPDREYWTQEMITALSRMPDAIEVYNGHYGVAKMRAGGHQPRYTHVWDALLTAGVRIWGMGNDDFHDPEDFNNAFNMVCVDEFSEQGIISAVKAGRFYASTGLLADRIVQDGEDLIVNTASDCRGRFVGPGGAMLGEAQGREFRCGVKGREYVRFEGEGDAGMLFAQPVFSSPNRCLA